MTKKIIASILLLILVVIICVSHFFFPKPDSAFLHDESFCVSRVFGDNMVLQQNEPICIWGTSPYNKSTVTARLGDSIGTAEVENGSWLITLSPRTYSSEPLVLEIFDSNASYISFENIRIGDVWLVIGQSNVEYTVAADPEASSFLSSLNGNENITLCTPGKNSASPDFIRWRQMNSYSAYSASDLCCRIAKHLDSAFSSSVPLGFVSLGFSGCELSDFMPPTSQNSFGGKIYESVLSYFDPMPAKGIIWYQGEADAAEYSLYTSKFTAMINHMRSAKSTTSELPVYAVELPPCFPDASDPDRQYINFGLVRSEIGSLTHLIDNFHLCPTSDLWRDKAYFDNLHPTNKKQIAERLALMLLSKEYQYGNEHVFFPPTLTSVQTGANSVTLSFSYVNGALSCPDFSGFTVIGKNWSIINNAVFTLSDDTLTVSSQDDIYLIRYNSTTENVFGENIFLSDSNLPAPAFSVTVKNQPQSPPHLYLISAGIVVLLILSHLFLKRLFKGDKL